MEAEKIAKSSQEQAVGAWIHALNQKRLDRLTEALLKQDDNLDAAMKELEAAFTRIKQDIILRNRGGSKGMHGFIAEIAECGIGNARQRIVGRSAVYHWCNDNGPVDLQRGAEAIQQKFVQSGGHLSLQAIAEHLRSYPDFLAQGGTYQIPKDHYEKIMAYLALSESDANKLASSNGGFSLRQWREVHAFFDANAIEIHNLEPSLLAYDEVQQGTIEATIAREKDHLNDTDREQRSAAAQDARPSLAEGVHSAAVGAVMEGAAAWTLAVVRKRRAGKRIKDFTTADWMEIAEDSGKGTVKGGVRGISIYWLTNYTATPAAAANAVMTAAFGVAEQAHLFRSGAINEVQFIENAELLCLDSAASALASLAGQALIPVPILGAVIGNAVGMTLYQIGKDSLSAKETKLIENYLQELAELDKTLSASYQQYITQLNSRYAEYLELLTCAFSPDIEKALDGSAALAAYMGVPYEEILDSYDKVVSYFTE